MADLGELVGTLLASLAHARRMSDEETAAVAEYYKTNPLLETMSVPRVRVPELTLELPILIESHEEGVADTPETAEQIISKLTTALNDSAKAVGVSIRSQSYLALREGFVGHLGRSLDLMRPVPTSESKRFPPESVARSADEAFMRAQKDEAVRNADEARQTKSEPAPPTFDASQSRDVRAQLTNTANTVAVKKEGSRPVLNAEIMTSAVKEGSDSASVARLKIVMREEGLEWTTAETTDGSVARTLTPE